MRIVQFRTDSDPYSLGKARRRIRNTLMQAGLSLSAADRVEIAVGEALANVYEHAYRAGVGPVWVKAVRAAEALTVAVTDNGRATEPPSVPIMPPPVRSGYRGRGLYMMRCLMDDVAISVNPEGHGLMVRMTMRLEQRDAVA